MYGCGLTARAVHAYFRDDQQYSIEGFVVDEEYYENQNINGLPLLSFQRLNGNCKITHSFAVCIGYSKMNKDREKVYRKLISNGWNVSSLHGSNLQKLPFKVGEGSIIMPGANLQPYCQIGNCVIIWPGAVVGHDSIIGDYCWLTAGSAIGGNTSVGVKTFVGINATVADSVSIGASNLLGGGVFVSKCTNDNEVFLRDSSRVARMGTRQFVKFTKFGD